MTVQTTKHSELNYFIIILLIVKLKLRNTHYMSPL